MVFYYQDLVEAAKKKLPNAVVTAIFFFLLISILALPFLIYSGRKRLSLWLSVILAIVQVLALYVNVIKYPL